MVVCGVVGQGWMFGRVGFDDGVAMEDFSQICVFDGKWFGYQRQVAERVLCLQRPRLSVIDNGDYFL